MHTFLECSLLGGFDAELQDTQLNFYFVISTGEEGKSMDWGFKGYIQNFNWPKRQQEKTCYLVHWKLSSPRPLLVSNPDYIYSYSMLWLRWHITKNDEKSI